MDHPTPDKIELRASRLQCFATLLAILLSIVGVVAAIVNLWGWAFPIHTALQRIRTGRILKWQSHVEKICGWNKLFRDRLEVVKPTGFFVAMEGHEFAAQQGSMCTLKRRQQR